MKKINSLILVLVCLLSNQAFTQDTGTNPFHASAEDQLILEKWKPSFFSDVRNLPKNFLFIFKGISLTSRFIDHPEVITLDPKISTSLISDAHPWTYSQQLGVIIEAPPENIVAMYEDDASSDYGYVRGDYVSDFPFLMKLAKTTPFHLRSPDALLNGTPPRFYNEVVLTGSVPSTHGKSDVKIKAYVTRCDANVVLSAFDGRDFLNAVVSCVCRTPLKPLSKKWEKNICFPEALPLVSLLVRLKERGETVLGLKLKNTLEN